MTPDPLIFNHDIAATSKVVWTVLAFLARPHYTVEHTNEEIGRLSNVSNRTTFRALDELERHGYLRREMIDGRRVITLTPDGAERPAQLDFLRVVGNAS